MDKYLDGWKKFLDLCVATQDSKALSQVFDLLFTAEEKANLAMRCLIIQELLAQKKTQRQIAAELEVSIAKITRGSNELKRMKAGLLEYLKDQFDK